MRKRREGKVGPNHIITIIEERGHAGTTICIYISELDL